MWASDACQTGGCWDSLHNICYSSCCLFCCWCATHSGGSKGRQSVEAHLGGGHTNPCLHLWLQSRGSYVFDLLDCAVHWEDSTAWWESAHVPGWSQRNHRLSGLSLLDQASPVLLAWVPSMALFICNESTWREPSLFSPRNSSLTLLKTHTCPSWNCPSLCYVLRLFTRCIFFFFFFVLLLFHVPVMAPQGEVCAEGKKMHYTLNYRITVLGWRVIWSTFPPNYEYWVYLRQPRLIRY